MRKKIFLIVLVLFNDLTISGQVPEWEWARRAGGVNFDNAYGLAVDLNGNTCVTGYFSSPNIVFGTDTFFNTINATKNLFIVMYDSSGTVLWSKSKGDVSYDDEGKALIFDSIGNIYFTGSFKSPYIVFDTDTLVNNTPGNAVGFLVKLDSFGNMIWTKNIGPGSGQCLAIDQFGDIYLAASFWGTVVLSNIVITSQGNEEALIAKFGPQGNCIWAKSGSGLGLHRPLSISVDLFGNSYITGVYKSGAFSFGSSVLTCPGAFIFDFFIAKLDSVGNAIWARGFCGSLDKASTSISTDPAGNFYIAGYSDVSPLIIDTVNLGSPKIFLVKFDSSGYALWGKSGGGETNFSSNTIQVQTDKSGNIYVAGRSSSMIFGSIMPSVPGLFVIKYDSIGNLIWSKTEGGNGACNRIVMDNAENLYLTGSFGGAPFVLGNDTLNNAGGPTTDLFVGKIGANIFVSTPEQISNSIQINIYPNPTTSQLNITSSYTIDKIVIADVIGQVVYSAAPHQKNVVVQMERAGIYFVSLTCNNQTVTKKLVVQR